MDRDCGSMGAAAKREGFLMSKVILLGLLLCSAALAMYARDLLMSALSLAGTSVAMAMFLFSLGLNYAAVFELSAGAGLTTVMFVTMLGLMSGTGAPAPESSERRTRWMRLAGTVITVVLVIILGGAFRRYTPMVPSADAGSQLGSVLWSIRAPDVLALGFVMLSGALGISALFHRERGGGDA